ncbi:MAG TPA: SH3 domain-containing protein, partial [Thermomicrobiales bacterium]|nr:SH3 domain-containing protein [Thermomicrobiales bacterium]
FTLEEGDAAFFPAGVTETSRTDEKDALDILVLSVEFDEPLDRDAAALTFTAGSGTTSDATDETKQEDEDKKDDGAIGAIVTTNVDDLNLRAEPSTDADVVDQLAAGIELEIVGGPVEAEGYTWYEVKVTAEGGNSGWVASDFLDGIPEPTAETTPTPESTKEASTGDTFASGAIVVTTENDVRIRAEGNLGGEIIDAFPAGTEYEITGDPVDADGYKWYPVSLVDDPTISGWIPSEFLAPEG